MATQIGKVYAVKCPDNDSYYKTIMSQNPFTGNLQSRVSNPIYGEIPDGIPIMHELMRSKLMSMNNVLPFTY